MRPRGQNPCIKVADTVLPYNQGTKRAFWRHAVVERLTKGTDECARTVVIRVSDEKGHVKLLQCSIQHLIPLEASTEDTSQDSTNELPPIMMIPKVCPRVLQGPGAGCT